MKSLVWLTGFILAITLVNCWAAPVPEASAKNIRRFAFVVGKNDGGHGRTPLKYAGTDAQAFTKVMEELGGLDNQDAIVLMNPNRKDFLARFKDVRSVIEQNKTKDIRTELFLYYSGHSDDEGLLLDGDKVTYKELKREIARISADLSVVILDSCASGSLTRVKGGMKKPPFLEDSLSKLKGYVVLTSSSAEEASQESDRVKGSFFTHYLVSGVRGAADVNVDSRVTLNEAYQYAFHQTLARTEKTLAGAQHPSYSIELAGSGELVMTDIRNTNSRIVLEDKLIGRFFIRNQDEKLVAEVDKSLPKPLSVGLEPGFYSITSFRNGKIAGATAKIGPNHALRLASADFRDLEGEATTLRGDGLETGPVTEEDLVIIPAEFSVMPGLSSNVLDQDRTANYFHLSVLNARSAKLNGVALSLLGFNRALKSATGVQLAPGANLVDSGPLVGAQIAVGYNSALEVTGAQIGGHNRTGQLTGFQAGVVNLARGEVIGAQIGAGNHAEGPARGVQLGVANVARGMAGVQLGVLNIAAEMSGLQLGVVNWSRGKDAVPVGLVNLVEGGMYRLGYAYNERRFHQLQFRNGSENSYSILQYGRRLADDSAEGFHQLGLGFGAQWTGERAFAGMEGVFNFVNRAGAFERPAWLTQLRLLPGWRITPAVSVSVGPTLNHVFKESGAFPSDFDPRKRFWVGYHAGLEIWL